MALSLYNTLTRKKEPFTPIDEKNIRMYVCGPTVYDRPHLGNARSVVVYDVLYRLLKHLYEKDGGKVTYVRNITDVDDKINAAAKANGEPISALTGRVEQWFHEDMAALNCLPPTEEPHATAHIPQMIAMIEKLIAQGNAYASEGHVLFSVTSYKDYGALSGRKLDDLIAGARVDVESYKKHSGDFVLWKPADPGDDASSVFDSRWGKGRPGWHIECSAMSNKYLGATFDIHGGGADLMFPHHENEIAQSCCASPGSEFAHVWVHNGFLTVGGEKMSKSLGNFTTVKDLLDKGVKGEVIRLALLSAKYNEPLDWNEKLVDDAKKQLDYFYKALERDDSNNPNPKDNTLDDDFITLLRDDLNTPAYFAKLYSWAALCHKNEKGSMSLSIATMMLRYYGQLLGLLLYSPNEWFKGSDDSGNVVSLINARIAAKKEKNWAEADRIRKELAAQGIVLEDKPDGTTDWRRA